MHYQAYLGTEKLGLVDITFSKELNQVTQFNAVFSNTVQNRNIISDNIDSILYIYRNDIKIFEGKINYDKIRYNITTIEIDGYSKYIELHYQFFSRDQDQYDIRRVQFDNIAANTILGYVLDGTSYTIAECPSTLISLRGEYETKLQWISAIAKACKYTVNEKTYSNDFWIDISDGVHIAQQRGSDKGVLNFTEEVEREINYSEIQNTAYGLGYGDGINQTSSIKTNADSVTTYGEREIVVIDRKFQEQTALDDEMQEYADAHAEPIEEIPCKISTWEWYNLDLEIGDSVTLYNENTGINGSYRIKKSTIGTIYTTLDITNTIPRLSTELQNIRRDLKVNGGYMQGQTVPLNFSNMDNVQNGFPLKMNIVIPAKTKAINAFYISFDLERYRAFVATTSGESSHNHNVTIPGHEHNLTIFTPWDDTNNVYLMGTTIKGSGQLEAFGGAGGTATSTKDEDIVASASGSFHDHEAEFGIMEDSDNSPSISIEIDSVDKTAELGGPWTTDQLEIDITPHIQTTGKHVIQLLSDQPARLQANVWGQVFIQSD
jgi:hypothetical protein